MSILAAALNKLGTLGEPSDIEKAAYLERLRAQQEAAQDERKMRYASIAASGAPAESQFAAMDVVKQPGYGNLIRQAQNPDTFVGPYSPENRDMATKALPALTTVPAKRSPFGSGRPISFEVWKLQRTAAEDTVKNPMMGILNPNIVEEAQQRITDLDQIAIENGWTSTGKGGGVAAPGTGKTKEQEAAEYKAKKAKKK